MTYLVWSSGAFDVHTLDTPQKGTASMKREQLDLEMQLLDRWAAAESGLPDFQPKIMSETKVNFKLLEQRQKQADLNLRKVQANCTNAPPEALLGSTPPQRLEPIGVGFASTAIGTSGSEWRRLFQQFAR